MITVFETARLVYEVERGDGQLSWNEASPLQRGLILAKVADYWTALSLGQEPIVVSELSDVICRTCFNIASKYPEFQTIIEIVKSDG